MYKTLLLPMALSAALTLLTGCFANSFDGCDFRGSLSIVHDRSILPPSMAATPFDLLLYPDRQAPLHMEQTHDTTLVDLPSARYSLVSVNTAAQTGVRYRKQNNTASDVELYLPVNTDSEGRRYVKPIPVPLFLSSSSVTVSNNEPVETLLLYKKISKQVLWKIKVTRLESAAGVDIASLQGSLPGVATACRTHPVTPLNEPASMILNPVSQEMTLYTQSTHVLGFTDSNLLMIDVTLTDGFKRTAGYDLTDKFKNFSGDIMTVELHLVIDGHKADLELVSITITDWKPGEEVDSQLTTSPQPPSREGE